MRDKKRLFEASAALKDATDEFIAAHAEWAGGHRPVLWATYNDSDDAVVVCPKSWAEKICGLFEDRHEPVHVVPFPGQPPKP
jgi:hypothetical protein